ncbi:unnamed protein product [Lota lota]
MHRNGACSYSPKAELHGISFATLLLITLQLRFPTPLSPVGCALLLSHHRDVVIAAATAPEGCHTHRAHQAETASTPPPCLHQSTVQYPSSGKAGQSPPAAIPPPPQTRGGLSTGRRSGKTGRSMTWNANLNVVLPTGPTFRLTSSSSSHPAKQPKLGLMQFHAPQTSSSQLQLRTGSPVRGPGDRDGGAE